jgi:HEAT repeat protein
MNIQHAAKLSFLLIILLLVYFFLSYWNTNHVAERLIKDATSGNLVVLQERVTKQPRTIKPLIAALESRRWYFGKDLRPLFAAYAFIRIGEPAAKYLIAALKNSKIRDEAIYALSRIKNKAPNAAELLILALKDKNPYVREGAARALGTCEAYNGEDHFIVVTCLDKRKEQEPAFRKVRYLRAIEPLIDTLKDKDLEVRKSAMRSLGEIGDAEAIEPLRSILNDENEFEEIRLTAIETLKKLKYLFPREFLLAMLKDKHKGVRESAVLILVEKKDSSAIPFLLAMLNDRNIYVRQNAETALIDMGEPAVEPLINFLRQDNLEFQRAVNALKKITAQDFGQDYNLWMKWWQEQNK